MSVKVWAASSLLILCVVAPSAGAEEGASQTPYAPPAVSMIRLVANCSEFENQTVLTTGYARFEYENFKICPSKELARIDPASCFWLTADDAGIPADRLLSLEEVSGIFVTVEGIVDCSKHLYAGSLTAISLILEVETARILWTTDPAMKPAMEQLQGPESTPSPGDS